jgi:hypothetical protein
VSSPELPPFGEAGPLRPPDTDERPAANNSPELSPELALVDPVSSGDERTPGDPEKEVLMSSHAPSEGTFFVGQQPAAPAPAPVVPPAPLVTPVEPEAPVAPLQAAEPSSGTGMRDVPLGTLIFRAGLLAEEQLEDALQEGMRTGKRLGEVLSQRGLIRDADLGRLLAGQQGLPFVDITTIPVDPAARQLLPESIARIQNALAFALEGGVPVVAVADPTNELVVENVRRALGSEPRLVVAAHGELARKIDEVYTAVVAQAVPPVAAPATAPVAEPPAAVVAEPVQVEQPAPAPAAPAPMPTVVPPPEERAPEALPEPVVAVAPPAPEPAEVPPLHVEAAAAPPLAPEPTVTPPVAEPTVVPAPVAPPTEQVAAVSVAPVEPAKSAPAAPAAAPTEPGLFVQAAEQALAPSIEEPRVAVTPEPAPVEPAAPETAATAAANGAPDATPTHLVVLRLTADDHVEIGGFASQEEAENFARTVVGRITRAQEQAEWPFFADRFLRPQTIVSVDVVAHETNKWMGSTLRSQWAPPPA